MRRLFDQLLGTVREFVKQRDDLVMVVPCQDAEVPLLMQALRQLDRESGSDLYLLFADDFAAQDAFVSDLAARLDEERRMCNEASPAAALPPVPSLLLDQTAHPAIRLEAGMVYANSLIDARRGQHFVWGMGPGTIANPGRYLELLADLVPRPDIRPWMRGARIVARVPAEFQRDDSPLADARRVRVRPFSIPPNAHEDELSTTANDPRAPMRDRMQAEVQLAYLDCAHSRFPQAVDRFLKALAFYQWAEIPVMQGLIICGLGDIARRQGNLPEAQHWYECAIVPASKDGNAMLMSTIVQHLAAIAFQQQRFAEAEERYGELTTLKRSMLDEDGVAEALEWQGLSQEHQQAYERAIDCWFESALLCKTFEMSDRLPRVLGHLKRGYRALDMTTELDQFEAEWSA